MKAQPCPIRMAAMSLRYPERSQKPERSGGLFPLTPALSLRERIPRHFDALCAPEPDEVVKKSCSSQHAVVQWVTNVGFWRFMGREHLSAYWDWSMSGEHFPALASALPLPKGEGRGEGEGGV